jgi:hypothetical protein
LLVANKDKKYYIKIIQIGKLPNNYV